MDDKARASAQLQLFSLCPNLKIIQVILIVYSSSSSLSYTKARVYIYLIMISVLVSVPKTIMLNVVRGPIFHRYASVRNYILNKQSDKFMIN